MCDLPDAKAMNMIAKKTRRDLIDKYMQMFAAEINKASNQGYCGYAYKMKTMSDLDREVLGECKKLLKKSGYRSHIDCHDTYYEFVISWRSAWFD